MRRRIAVTLGWLMLIAPVVGRAQGEPPPACSVVPEPQPCGSTPAAKAGATATTGSTAASTDAATGKSSSTEKFPFPGETSGDSSSVGPALPDLSGAGAAATSSVPASTGAAGNAAGSDTAGGADAAHKAATQFPFPEETPAATPGAAKGGGLDLSGANKDSFSSSSSSSSSNAGDDNPTDAADDADSKPAADASGLKDKGSEGSSGRHLLHRVNPVGTKLQSPDEREAEDLSVAHYYTQSGDFAGAYLRSQDAVKTVPDDPDAHFALAEAALKLNKRAEAIAEYNACLKLDPSDKVAKAARKALARLGP